MNKGERRTYKPRKCALFEEQIIELGELLKTKYFTCGEIENYVKEHFHWRSNLFLILSVLEVRGYMCGEEDRVTPHGKKRYYKIFTDEDYEKIEEERRENAKRRLLAAVSY